MLSRLDDYPIHQTPEPVAHPASTDRNVYDRYWFNGFTTDGSMYIGAAMGLYPHRGVIDGAFSVVLDGVQRNVHVSGRRPADPAETAVGPWRVEVVAPMRRTRLVLDAADHGLACDLTFSARSAGVQEGRTVFERDGRRWFDSTRFAQFGRWSGTVEVAGQTIAVDENTLWGTKDRSWGIRPVGEPDVGGAPDQRPRQFCFLWAPLQWDDRCTHFGVFEDEFGHAVHADGVIAPCYPTTDLVPGADDPHTVEMAAVERTFHHAAGTRWIDHAQIVLVEPAGTRHEIELEPIQRFQMMGIGYGHPDWRHGTWKGELAVGSSSFVLADLDPLRPEHLHIQHVVRATEGDRVGYGALEQLVVGPHAQFGFTDLLDGAR